MRWIVAVASGVLAVMFFAAAAAPAGAAPNNQNTETFEVKCDGLGKVTVSSNGEGDVVFSADGQPLVAKVISGTSKATLSVEDGPTFRFTETFEEGSSGTGFEGQLIECSFKLTFTEEFTLTKHEVEELGLGDEFIGATVTVSATVKGTAQVLAPGS
ncbi:MAG: hypothetical protein HYS09_09950 [Chloroflexi bacterium]|nr:hypothetical protein [Chloroflexota bacterium]